MFLLLLLMQKEGMDMFEQLALVIWINDVVLNVDACSCDVEGDFVDDDGGEEEGVVIMVLVVDAEINVLIDAHLPMNVEKDLDDEGVNDMLLFHDVDGVAVV